MTTAIQQRISLDIHSLSLCVACVLCCIPTFASPDISITAISTDEAVIQPGKLLHISWTIQNQGSSQAAGTWHDELSISSDSAIGNDTALYTRGYFTVLDPTESVTLTFGLMIPPATPIGNYWFVVQINHLEELTENDYSNNFGIVGPIKVTGPNLVVSDISLSSIPIGPDDSFQVTWQTKNVSNDLDATGNWRDTVYLTSTHPFFNEVQLATYSYFTTMQPGEFVEFTRTVTIPADIWAGEYCIKVCTDVDEDLIETIEYDNCQDECGITLSGSEAPAFEFNHKTSMLLCAVFVLIFSISNGKRDLRGRREKIP